MVQRSGRRTFDARRIKRLRQKPDGARGKRDVSVHRHAQLAAQHLPKRLIGIAERRHGATLLDDDIETEHCRVVRSEESQWSAIQIGDADLHSCRNADRQADSGARLLRQRDRICDHIRYVSGSELVWIDPRAAHDWNPDLSRHAGEGRRSETSRDGRYDRIIRIDHAEGRQHCKGNRVAVSWRSDSDPRQLNAADINIVGSYRRRYRVLLCDRGQRDSLFLRLRGAIDTNSTGNRLLQVHRYSAKHPGQAVAMQLDVATG